VPLFFATADELNAPGQKSDHRRVNSLSWKQTLQIQRDGVETGSSCPRRCRIAIARLAHCPFYGRGWINCHSRRWVARSECNLERTATLLPLPESAAAVKGVRFLRPWRTPAFDGWSRETTGVHGRLRTGKGRFAGGCRRGDPALRFFGRIKRFDVDAFQRVPRSRSSGYVPPQFRLSQIAPVFLCPLSWWCPLFCSPSGQLVLFLGG